MTAPRTFRRAALAPLVALLVLAPIVAACGGGHHHDVFLSGNVFVDNLTDTTAPEDCEGFFLAPSGGTFTGNLLSGPLPAGSTEFVGSFTEGFYDGEADMEFGDVIQWFDVFVAGNDDTYFEIY